MHRPCLRLVPVLLAVLVLVPVASADLVFLKDGFTLRGKVRREGDGLLDAKTNQNFSLPKGFWEVDDGVRRVIFSKNQVQDVDDKNVNQGLNIVQLVNDVPRLNTLKVDPFLQFSVDSSWSPRWERKVTFRTAARQTTTDQRIKMLTPELMHVEAKSYYWDSFYLTRELDPETARDLFFKHRDMADPPGTVDPKKRIKAFRFLLQAGWHDAAGRELDLLLRDDPDEKQQVEDYRSVLEEGRTHKLIEDIELASQAGRHDWVRQQLPLVQRAHADARQIGILNEIQARYAQSDADLKEAAGFLNYLPPRIENSEQRAEFADAAQAMQQELCLDTIDRLRAFLTFARQAKRQEERGAKPSHDPAQLMALAAAGWTGIESAEARAEAGLNLWRTRNHLLAVARQPDASARQQLLAKIEAAAVPFDELAQVIRHLPPAEPLAAVEGAQELQLPSPRLGTISCVLELPPEYHPGREYPLLIVLHDRAENPRLIFNRWRDAAMRNGYILVAPAYEKPGRAGYFYTAEEHAAVMNLLPELKRRCWVDPDRVFISGLGAGGEMAFDVALSHPDQFAGAVPISAAPRSFSRSYWENAAHLPFYVVAGDQAADPADPMQRLALIIRRQFEQWVSAGYANLYVEYKGRCAEWFAGELPFIFDWMNRKKRATGLPRLPRCRSLRETDNQFYWLAGDGLSPAIAAQATKKGGTPATAYLYGAVVSANHLNIEVKGFQKLIIRFTPGLVTFDQPVKIYVNTRPVTREIRPSRKTLIEEFHRTADRKQLVFATFEF